MTIIDLLLLISAPNESIVHRSDSVLLFGLDLSYPRMCPAVNSGPSYA